MQAYASYSFIFDTVQEWAYFPDALSTEACDKLVEYGRQQGLETGSYGSTQESNSIIRESLVSFIPPTDFMSPYYRRISDVVLSLNEQFFKFNIHGFGEHFQFTEYRAPSGKYQSHVDRAYNIPVRKLSIVVQLTDPDEYEGGDLEIIPQIENPHKMPRKRGTLIAFPSYQLHRVTPVTKGTRNSLVGWVNGKPFR